MVLNEFREQQQQRETREQNPIAYKCLMTVCDNNQQSLFLVISSTSAPPDGSGLKCCILMYTTIRIVMFDIIVTHSKISTE